MDGNAAAVLEKPGFRKIDWLERDIAVERRPDGVIVLKSRIPLQAYEKHIPASLAKWAKQAPERTWLAQRGGPDRQWRHVSYGEAKRTVDALTQGLLDLGIQDSRPVAILSGNSIEHALMTQAAMQARLPAAPVSPAYSLMSSDFGKLKSIAQNLTPGLVFAADGKAFARAIDAAVPGDVEIVVTANPPGRPATLFADLLLGHPTSAVDDAHKKVGPDTVAKVLFTSGSTGYPKGVINTQRMLCSN